MRAVNGYQYSIGYTVIDTSAIERAQREFAEIVDRAVEDGVRFLLRVGARFDELSIQHVVPYGTCYIVWSGERAYEIDPPILLHDEVIVRRRPSRDLARIIRRRRAFPIAHAVIDAVERENRPKEFHDAT